MRWLTWLIAIFILLVLEGGFFSRFEFLPVVPALVMVFCAVAVLSLNLSDAAFVVVVAGIMLDFVSALPDGVLLLSLGVSSAITYAVIYWWLAREYSLGMLFASVAVTTVIFVFAVLGFSKLFDLFIAHTDIDYAYLIVRKLVWYIVLNLVVTYPVYYYFYISERLARKFGQKS